MSYHYNYRPTQFYRSTFSTLIYAYERINSDISLHTGISENVSHKIRSSVLKKYDELHFGRPQLPNRKGPAYPPYPN